jgi:hypothetical protein
MTIDEEIKHQEEIADRYTGMSEYADNEATAEECARVAAEHRQLAEWLTNYKEAIRLLKSATNVLNMFLPCDEDYNCSECIKQRQNCDYDDSFKWRYADEALKLIGGEQNDT